jgi:chromosome segregation ATPase
MNQLEEIIDQKNETIELLRKQLDTMTSTGESESNSLQKQMLKMEQSMKVKDRFCTLLSERVNQLTRELEDSHKGTVGDYEGRGSFIEKVEIDSSLETVIKEHGIKEKNMRKMIGELQEQIEKERNEKKEALTQADETKQKLNEIQNDYGNHYWLAIIYL